ncbi:MAG: sel1 repeat family protein [Planctomycetes bacterium]|nr:sel1 repeat family protein [Planctomycetota bacterium]
MRALATAVLLVAAGTCLAADFDVDALFEKWKQEDSRTLEGWRVLDDPTLIEKLGPLGATLIDGCTDYDQPGDLRVDYLLQIAYTRGIAGAPKDLDIARLYQWASDGLRRSDPYLRYREELSVTYSGDSFRVQLREQEGRSQTELWADIKALAEGGYPSAYLMLTQRVESRLTDEENSRQQRACLVLAAEGGCLPAMTWLGHQLVRGGAIERDKAGGLDWLGKAADASYWPALQELARFYAYPNGQEPNLAKCRDYLTRAAEAGDKWAMHELAVLPGVEFDRLTFGELYDSYVEHWAVPTESKDGNGRTILTTPPNPVLVVCSGAGELLKPMVEPPEDSGLSEDEIAHARTMYGECLLRGVGGVSADPELGIHWLNQVARTDKYPAASLLYAEARLERGDEAGRKVAVLYLCDAVKAGFRPALRLQCQITFSRLGGFYGDLNLGVRAVPVLDWDEAIQQLEKLAEAGDETSAKLLARQSTPLRPTWLPWLEATAKSGDGPSALRLFDYYSESEHADSDKAAWALRIAARDLETCDDAAARQAALDRADDIRRCAELAAQLDEAIARDCSPAAFLTSHPWIAGLAQRAATRRADLGLYGICLMKGHGIARDYSAARLYLTDEAGEALSSYFLAQMMEQGLGAEPDRRGAIWVYEAVAEAGAVYAMHRLGELKREDKQDAKANEWFKKAAEGGCLPSMVELAKVYHDGTGIDKDADKANEWAKKAADAGNEAAKKLLEEWKS